MRHGTIYGQATEAALPRISSIEAFHCFQRRVHLSKRPSKPAKRVPALAWAIAYWHRPTPAPRVNRSFDEDGHALHLTRLARFRRAPGER